MINRVRYSDIKYLSIFTSEHPAITAINNLNIPERTLTELYVCGFLSDKVMMVEDLSHKATVVRRIRSMSMG
jgi:hypothetical protein